VLFKHLDLDPDPATQINADPDPKPCQNTDPDLIWSLVLRTVGRQHLYGRNLQLSRRLDNRSSPEPLVIWLAGILTEKKWLTLKKSLSLSKILQDVKTYFIANIYQYLSVSV
jgi:hypothetical protein